MIAFNSIHGVSVTGGERNAIRCNSIWGNTAVFRSGLGIDLATLFLDPGRNTENDSGDVDTGSNGLQNYPRLTSAQQASGLLTIGGVLDSTANSAFEIDIFVSDTPDPGGYGEGHTYLGTIEVTTESDGLAWFEETLAADVTPGQVITTTATSQSGNTSEFSERIAIGDELLGPFVVNTVDDVDDGWCNATHCSLREAIHAANLSLAHDEIRFNIPGAGVQTITPQLMLPVLTDPVTVDGYTQPGATMNTLAEGINAQLLIEIVGSELPLVGKPIGLELSGGDSLVRGLVINRSHNINLRIRAGGNNVIAGNFLGCDPMGLQGFTKGTGLQVLSSSGNLIGGPTAADRNLISGNFSLGLQLSNPTAFPSEHNSGNRVQNNYIGTDRHGLAVLGGQKGGISTSNGTGNIIGGAASVEGNLITGNANFAVFVTGNDSVIQGNLLGTDRTGRNALGNGSGLAVSGSGNLVGGVSPGQGNIVAANTFEGMTVFSDKALVRNVVQGNYIGTNEFDDPGLGNGRVGLYMRGTSLLGGKGTLVGGLEPGAGNTIAYSGGVGILVKWSSTSNVNIFNTGNSILSNRMYANTSLGIDLISANGGRGLCPICTDGPLPNDAGDFDNGHNRLQNTPVIRAIDIDPAGDLLVEYAVDTNQVAVYPLIVEFFRADAVGLEGEMLLGRNTYDVAEAQAIKLINLGPADIIGFADGMRLIGTATDSGGNTSEFSYGLADLSVGIVDEPDPVAAGESLTLDVSAINDGPFLADAVVLSIGLPAGFVAVTVSPAAPVCILGGGTVECNLIRMAADERFNVQIIGTSQVGGTLTTNVTVTSGTEDPNPLNNEASADTTVEGDIVDCAGVPGGSAFIDACGVCVGGTTGLEPDADQDCYGDCFGDATFDNCGVCAGGATGLEPDADLDCAGACFGSAFLDECGVCSGGTSGNEPNSDKDCAGVCFGPALEDGCGICSGGSSGHDAESDRDCAAECFGAATFDDCGICAGGTTGIEPNLDKDCHGDCFGDATFDVCSICAGGSTGLEPNADVDCEGVCFGEAFVDGCGVCSGGGTGHVPDSDLDCSGDCFGGAVVDDCGVCAGGTTGLESNADKDCHGDCFGAAFIDVCGICAGGNTGVDPSIPSDCTEDCAGVIGGSAFVDDCGVCAGGTTGVEPNKDKDCHGDCFGTAEEDNCAVCAGGNTGLESDADQDCAGTCFGTALVDDCGICAGGTTGLEPNADKDCHGDCFGEASIDDCGVCAGGNTGLKPNTTGDCESVAMLDIKPGSCPNAFNRDQRGVLPIAILSNSSFDVAAIDLDSLSLSRTDGLGVSLPLVPDRPSTLFVFDDVAAPRNGESCECHTTGPDGMADLLLHVYSPLVSEALALDSLTVGASVELQVRGILLDGSAFQAVDCIWLTNGKNHRVRLKSSPRVP